MVLITVLSGILSGIELVGESGPDHCAPTGTGVQCSES